MSIRKRLLLTFGAMALIGSVLQLLIAGLQLQKATIEFYQHQLELDTIMVAASLVEPLEHYLEGESSRDMQKILSNLQSEVGYGYQLLDRNYHVIGFTPDIFPSVSQMAETAELVELKTNPIGSDIRSDENHQSRLFVAVPINYEGEKLGYLVLSQSMQATYDEIKQRWLELTTATLPVLILVIGASLWISGTISRPIQQLRASALQMADGKLQTRIAIQSQDELGQLAQSFNFMAQRLEALLKAQRSFVSNAAHELRTPLMTLKLRIEALEDEALDTIARANYLAEIHQEIDHMAEMVSSLLILARIDEGRHEKADQVVETAMLLRDITRHWTIEARRAGLTFTQDIPATLPPLPISTHDLRLILNNILGNAVKYTPEGSIIMKVFTGRDYLTIQVQDTGVGFEKQQKDQLFTRFYRAETVRSTFHGTGLGLSIVQTLLEKSGGKVMAESSGEGQGAIFTLTIPYHEPALD